MTIQSVGYEGDIDETAWAEIIPMMGGRSYGVKGAKDWAATIGTSDRSIVIGTGTGFGYGVRDVNTEPVTVALPSVASGVRWDLICAKRRWGTSATTFTSIQGTTEQKIPTRKTMPGEEDDQPLYLAKVEAGKSQVSDLIDLRVWGGDGGATARHALALQYLTQLGTSVLIDGVEWKRSVNSDGNAVWLRTPILRQGGSVENLTNGTIANPGTLNPLIVWTVPEVIPAGAMLHIRADIEIYLPNGSAFAGFAQLLRGDLVLAQRRWSNHLGRNQHYVYPSVEANIAVTQEIPGNTQLRFVVTSDALSSGGVELWHAYVSWGVS